MGSLLVLLIYPFIILVVVDPSFFRSARRLKEELPGWGQALARYEILVKEFEGSGRWLLIGKFFIAAAFLFVWMKSYDFSVAALGLSSRPTRVSLEMALAAGILLLCGKVVFEPLWMRCVSFVSLWFERVREARRGVPARGIPPPAPDPSQHPLSRGPMLLWVLTFVLGGAFEEPWRAFCLVSAREAGWHSFIAVALSAGAFAFAQETGFPARSTTYEDVWQFGVGVFLAILFLEFDTVVIPYLAFLVYNIANLMLIRRAVASSRRAAPLSPSSGN
jgi:hypothetical protein